MYNLITLKNLHMKTVINLLSLMIFLVVGTINAQSNLQLNVVNDNDEISIEWTTASETNSSYFLIEASTDGKTFSPAARVKAAGYSLTRTNYNYVPDGKALYYRVSLVNMEGSLTDTIAMQLYQPVESSDSLVRN